ncbi:MAG: hypothetical protein QOJ32_910 [Frankiaceae bacterium]|jgi:hypothetical protein|nr:hypothetical protein [Frankiaceae bacterium]MDQ1634101.1 hypothetical protein [Frankiaceae bacterium]
MVTTAFKSRGSAPERTDDTARNEKTGRALYGALTGLAAVAVLLQGLWAGIFLRHDGEREAADSWIGVHATDGEVAIALAALATAVALWKLRHRKELWIGAGALTVLLILESYLGGLIRDQGKTGLTAVHIPLAMALMGLVVYLPLRAARGPRRPAGSVEG